MGGRVEDAPLIDPQLRLASTLGRSRLGPRWLALDPRDASTHVLYAIESRDTTGLFEKTRVLQGFSQAHLLPIEGVGVDASGTLWLASPYTGSHDGLLTLESLRQAKGGRLMPSEVEEFVSHILGAVRAAHERGLVHGPISASEILVDRRGSLLIEMYSLARALEPTPASEADAIRDEVRSVVALAYHLLTGIVADEPRIPATRLVRRLEASWDRWFELGLDPLAGFADAGEALQHPALTEPEPGPVRVVLGRVRSALTNG